MSGRRGGPERSDLTDATTPAAPPPRDPDRPAGIHGLLRRLGWRADRRAQPFLSHALGAGGGALVAIGVIVLGADLGGDDQSGTPGGLLCALAIAIALIAIWKIGRGPVRSACVAAIAICVPALWFFVITLESATGSLTAFYLLSIASLLVLFLVGPARGRTILLGIALLFVWIWIAGEVAGTNELAQIQTESSSSFEEESFEEEEGFPEGNAETDAGVVSLVFGTAYLAGAWWLDREHRHGAATPLVVSGIVAAVTGAVIVGVDAGAVGGGLLAVAVGLGTGFVGARGRDRRASTWIGALTATVGITVVANELADVEDSAKGFAILVIVVGIALAVSASGLAGFLGEPDDEEPAPAAPPGS